MKKLICFILSITLIITSAFTALPVLADEIEPRGEDYENARRILTTVCPDFPLNDGEITTRAEFTAAMAKLMNKSGSLIGEAPFKDVAADNIYAADIAFAKGYGLISNVDLFYPDTPVTYAQAIKIVMTAIGYGKKAEYTGGYPTGYLVLANETNIGMGLRLDNDATLTHAQASELILDAVCEDILETTSVGTSYDYTVTEGKNILSLYHNIYVAEGLVSANAYTGIDTLSGAAGEGTIKINGKLFVGEDYEDLIGRNTRVFYRDDSKNSIVLAYAIDNDEYTYTKEDGASLKGLTVTVNPDGGQKSVSFTLEGDYSVIYNGKYFSANDYAPYLLPESGTVTLVNNDADSEIELIVINEISYSILGSVNVFEEKLYDKNQKNGHIDLSKTDNYKICESDGTPLSIEDLEAGNILGIIKSEDGALVNIIRYTDKVGGIYTSNSTDGKLYIDDEEYELSSYYINNIKALNQIKLGAEIIAHLGTQNQIVYIEEFSTGLSYGYIIDAGDEGTSAINKREVVKMLCADGEVKVVPLAKKTKINGESKSSADALSHLLTLKAGADVYKVVKYQINANGEITTLYDTVMNTDGISVLTRENVDEARPVLFDDNTKYLDDPTDPTATHKLFFINGVFYPYFKAADDAVVMQVPKSGTDEAKEDRYYTLSSMTKLNSKASSGSGNENQECYGYDVDKNGAAFILWISADGANEAVNESTATGVVESVTDGLNPEGEKVKIIKMYHNKAWNKYYSRPTHEYVLTNGVNDTLNAINAMRPGDIVRASVNSDNEIIAAKIDFTYSTKTVDSSAKMPAYGGPEFGLAAGYVYTYSNGLAMLVRDMTLPQINANAASLSVKNLFPANLNRGNTVFVKLERNRTTNQVTGANVYTETDLSVIEDFFTSGDSADYVVQRSRYLDVSMNIIYVN